MAAGPSFFLSCFFQAGIAGMVIWGGRAYEQICALFGRERLFLFVLPYGDLYGER